MNGKMRIWIGAFLFAVLSVLSLAQAEKPEGQLYFVEEMKVKMDKFSDFDAVIQKVAALCKEHDYPYPWAAYSTNDMFYYFVYPVKTRADIEDLFSTWDDLVAKMGKDKWQALYQRMVDSAEFIKYYEMRHLPAHSYTAADTDPTPQDDPYTYWGFCYTKPGHEGELADIYMKYVELYKSKNCPSSFDSYVVLSGAELPAYFYMMRGKSLSGLFGESEKSEEMTGAESANLWTQLASHLRRYEYKIGMFRPDLSYMPEQK